MAVTETPVLLISKNESGEKRLVYPITRADCVDGLEEVVDEKVAEKSVSWNDLTDRPFGVGEVIPAQEVTFLGDDDDNYAVSSFPYATMREFTFVDGYRYRVLWDNVEYVCVAKGGTSTYIGNFSLQLASANQTITEGTDTGEPFYVTKSAYSDYFRIVSTDGTVTTHIISIQEEKQIDPKWLPDIPHFNLVEMGLGDPTEDENISLSYIEADTTEIFAALENGPVKFTITLDGRVQSHIITGRYSSDDDAWFCESNYDVEKALILAFTSNTILCKCVLAESVLPEVTNSDNGKVLTVVGATWSAQDAPTSLPNVTTEDDGKVLSVKNGVWTATEAPAGEGGSVSTETDILAEQSLPFVDCDGLYLFESSRYADVYPNPKLCDLIAGETYIVVWDGTVYTCVATAGTFGSNTGIGLGNFAMAGLGDDTGEPFLFGVFDSGENTACFTTDITSEAHTVRIYQKESISWNNLADKPFYEELVTVFEGEFQNTLRDEDGDGVGDAWESEMFIEDASDSTLEIGDTYNVTWDGVEYSCVATDYYGLPFLGNTLVIEGVDSGEPFSILRDDGTITGMNGWMSLLIDPPTDLTVSGLYTCKIEHFAVKKIDDKYQHQTDWNVTDKKSASCLLNRPFGVIVEAGAIVSECTVECNLDFDLLLTSITPEYIHEGIRYSAQCGDLTLSGIGISSGEATALLGQGISNPGIKLYDSSGAHAATLYVGYQGMFNFIYFEEAYQPSFTDGQSYDVKVVCAEEVVQQLHAKYNPIMEFSGEEIIPETVITVPYNSDAGVWIKEGISITESAYNAFVTEAEAGNNVIFSLNGIRCEAPTMIGYMSDGTIDELFAGNLKVFGGEDNGQRAFISFGKAGDDINGYNYACMVAIFDPAPSDTNATAEYTFQLLSSEYKVKKEYLPMDAIKAYIDEYLGEVLRGNY